MNGNSVTIVGNLVDDPELRFTANGQAMAKFRVAVSRRWQDRSSGEWKEESSFFGCTAWREQAENAAESLKRGTRVIISGSLQQRSWETQEGDKRSVVEIQVDEVGPSLRWATASIERNARKDDGGGGGGRSGGGGPGGGGAGAGGGGSGGASGGGWDSPPDDEF
jgi:single-strand DNA-binding protein